MCSGAVKRDLGRSNVESPELQNPKQPARGPTPPLPLLRPGSVLALVTKVSGRVTRQFLHRGSCLYFDLNVMILPVLQPKLSSLGEGKHRGQGNR